MLKILAAVTLAIMLCGLGGCASNMTSAPTRAPGGGPVNAPPNECVTDDGYGRWHPCGNMS